MHLYLVPDGGLCNRMRAMDSALALVREHGWDMTVYWRRQRGFLNCHFNVLFEPIAGITMREVKKIPYGYDDSLRSRLVRRWHGAHLVSRLEAKAILGSGMDLGRWREHKAVFLVTYSRFHPNEEEFKDFRPTPMLLGRIDSETVGFKASTIGLHIRRTDNIQSITYSPLELFEAAIDRAITKDPAVNFYLASDSVETKRHLMVKYGPRILCNLLQPDRDSREGIVQAAVELYALSRTSMIYGSYWSSYSETSAQLGRIPLVPVTQESIHG